MADYSTISRIAKILARATSPEPNEAKSALDHAYKRMVRDSVTLADLLTLPEAELFQDTIVRLVDVILAHQTDLSPSAKRLAYAEYMRLIVAKFSGAGEGASTSQGQSREDAARDYRERYGYKEETRKQENDKSFNQKNEKTEKQENNFSFNWPKPLAFIVSPWHVIRPLFSYGGLFWLFLHEPVAMLRLLGASILWGMGFSLALMTVAAFGHIVTHTQPVVDVSLHALFGALTAIGTLWRMRLFMKADW
jgi:hypothetical protein